MWKKETLASSGHFRPQVGRDKPVLTRENLCLERQGWQEIETGLEATVEDKGNSRQKEEKSRVIFRSGV